MFTSLQSPLPLLAQCYISLCVFPQWGKCETAMFVSTCMCPRARSVHKENRRPLVKTWRKEFRFEQREEKAEHSGKRTVMWCDMWLMRLALKDYNLSHLPAVLRKRWLFNKHDSTVKAIQSGSRLAAWFVESGLFKLHVLNYSFVRIRRIRQQCFA